MREPTRVLLVDDHTLFRESLRRVLEAETRFQVVAEAATLQDTMVLLQGGAAFDLALIDFQLSETAPHENGLAAVRAVRAAQPAVAVLLLTAGVGRAELHEAAQMRAGVFLKTEPARELLLAMDRTLAGDVWFSSGATRLLQTMPTAAETTTPEAAFTARELLVLRHITEGLSNKEIADQLSISESAVKALLQRLFEKTSVRTRSQLVRYVFECSLTLP